VSALDEVRWTEEPTRSADTGRPSPLAAERPSLTRAFVLLMASIAFGLGGLYLVRAGLADTGGFTLASTSAPHELLRLMEEWRFLAGGLLLLVVLLISVELWGCKELSKVVPLYSLSYVVIALIGQLFLDERVTLQRWIGIAAIVTGVVLVLRS
jgi:drug/metabolite transporter (DMT)-like permease